MKTIQSVFKNRDYWYGKTISTYVSNARQRVEISTELQISNSGNHSFISNMIVLFDSLNSSTVFCKIETIAVIEFYSENLNKEISLHENIFLLIKNQYQFAISIFRQNQVGTYAAATHIDKNLINADVYNKLKDEYDGKIYFEKVPPISKSFDPYGW